MERFPKIKTEMTCAMEKAMRTKARESYYEKLIRLKDEATNDIPEKRTEPGV